MFENIFETLFHNTYDKWCHRSQKTYISVEKVSPKRSFSVMIGILIITHGFFILPSMVSDHCTCQNPSNQSLVFTNIESFPFEQRLSLDSFLKNRIVCQNRRIDFSPVEKQVKEGPFSFVEGENNR